jgi:hypothetical protein
VRPHLEFSTQAWSPWTEADKSCLEKVQQRAVKMVSGLKSDEYSERLAELEMPTLEERRHQADMAMVHKTSDISKKDYKTTLAWYYLKGRIIYREEEGKNKILI